MSYYEKRIADLEARVAQLAREQRLKAIPVEVERLELKATNLYNAMKVKMEADEVICKARAIILQKEANETAFNFVIKELQAEVERLRKAGDKLVFALEAMDIIMDMDSEHPEVAEWNAAKEGKV